MSNKKKIELSLKKLILDNNQEFVAMLSGEWGIVKTYFWNEFQEKELKGQKEVVYISLFGLNSLDEIKNEVIFKISKYTKKLNKYRERIQNVKGGSLKVDDMGLSIGGAVINATLSLFSTTDFKNIVICFDDFERLSDSVSLKDVMGLISQFKEQKKCKIIMILNEEELDKLSNIEGKKHNEIFALYKEKIIDYSFFFKPSFDELFIVVKDEIKYFKTEWIQDFFAESKLQNLRIMKQIVFQLNHFQFIQAYHLNDRVIQEFVKIALNIFVFYAKSSYSCSEWLKLKEYKNKTIPLSYYSGNQSNIDEKEDEDNPEYEEKLLLYGNYGSSQNRASIELIVYNFIENYIVEDKNLKLLLKENNLNLEYYIVQDKLTQLIDRIQLDFQCNLKESSSKIYLLLEEYKESITSILSIDSFHFYMSIVKEHTDFNDDFENTIIREYIEKQPERRTRNLNSYESFIGKYYPKLLDYLKEIENKSRMKNITIDVLLDLFSRLDSGWEPNDYLILNNLSFINIRIILLNHLTSFLKL
ncbi:MAG: Unknown protein [uncultured Sulfurovum sp.]|uniref:KAP NTPase domain-containing protein n=1 Tax=uncultured Sulfurovum sp. TaxID=269237 RepID=A0A6S6THB6_9BACT|nr:MAG: Unknown protein [uncultured Sulfurovum sp.]